MSQIDLKNFSNLVALPHSVFALPFALSSFLIAWNNYESPYKSNYLSKLFLMVIAIVFARTAAMTFNRIVDRHYDKLNPRTKNREIPSGDVSLKQAYSILLISSISFILSSYLIGLHCFILSIPVLLLLFFYSYFKRFTAFAHLYLGFCLGLSPLGAWWILNPYQLYLIPTLLSLGVVFWVCGFDIIYSCQDIEFDKKTNLHSIPALFGIKKSLQIAKALHIISAILFLMVGILANLGQVYFIGFSLILVAFALQHKLVKNENLDLINHAFFTSNGVISLGYLLLVILSLYL